jgi:superfamily II DNA or RNA helicase
MFSTALNSLNAKVKIGISATPKRKDGKHVFLADYFSPYLVEARDPRQLQDPVVQIKRTDFRFPVIDPKRDWSRQLNQLCKNKDYLAAIADFAKRQIVSGRCPLILGERVQMLKDLQELIPDSRLDTLYLTCPSNNPIKLEQRIGRIIREHPDKQVPMIVDWWLSGGIVARQQTKRLEWYKSRGYYIL